MVRADIEASVLPWSVPPQSNLNPWSPINTRKVLSRAPESNSFSEGRKSFYYDIFQFSIFFLARRRGRHRKVLRDSGRCECTPAARERQMLDPSCISLESPGEHQTGTCAVPSPGDIGKSHGHQQLRIAYLSPGLWLGRKACSKNQREDF